MTATKSVPSLGVQTAAFSVPARLCAKPSPSERLRCNLAPHAATTLHAGYDPVTDTTVNW